MISGELFQFHACFSLLSALSATDGGDKTVQQINLQSTMYTILKTARFLQTDLTSHVINSIIHFGTFNKCQVEAASLTAGDGVCPRHLSFIEYEAGVAEPVKAVYA